MIPTGFVDRTAKWVPLHGTLTERIYDIGHDLCEAELDDVAAFVSVRAHG